MNDFRKLKSWEKAHALALRLYRLTQHFPKEKVYGLSAQIRSASVSIPANIAEGYGRGGDAELARFLSIAAGSACELQYHVLLARDLGYISKGDHQRLDEDLVQVKRMLSSFISKLKAES